ncbi:hypothetical protein J7K24_00890 [bacterium]|nr:hypothetical protein [bacterium]
MYVKTEPFGYLVFGEIIGSAWLSLVETVLNYGEITEDEGRKRLSLQNIRIKSLTQDYPDPLIEKYGNRENIEKMVRLFFNEKIMYDFDVIPSFSPGSKSYYARIKEWSMLDFVIKRLTRFPESKKAVMSFVRKEDYERTLNNPQDDYLPCIVSLQFRLLESRANGYDLTTLFNARSIDAYQKACGNFAAFALLSKEIARRLEKTLSCPVCPGVLDGLITDAHIYQETIKDAEDIIKKYKKYEKNIQDP